MTTLRLTRPTIATGTDAQGKTDNGNPDSTTTTVRMQNGPS